MLLFATALRGRDGIVRCLGQTVDYCLPEIAQVRVGGWDFSSSVNSSASHKSADMATLVSCAGCSTQVDSSAKGALATPKGDDWRGLLGVPLATTTVCKRCKAKIGTMRETARGKRARGDALTPAEALVPESSKRCATDAGWGVASQTKRCVVVNVNLRCL